MVQEVSKKVILVLYLIFFTNTIYSSNIDVLPILYTHYESSGSDYIVINQPVTVYGWGIGGSYINDNISIEADFINHTYIGLNKKPNLFSSRQGIAQFVKWPYQDVKSIFDSRISNMKFIYSGTEINFEFGKYNKKWGPGLSSLTFSNKSPSYPQIGFNWRINHKLRFEYFIGMLRSLIEDTLSTKYYNNQLTTKQIDIKRNIVAHRFEYDLTPTITIGGSESMVYAKRDFDIHYFPFIAFWPMKNYIGDIDNMQMSIDVIWRPNTNSSYYTTVFIDEMDPRYILDKYSENWWGWQFGFYRKDFLIKSSTIRMEYNWLDHRVYRNRITMNDYYHYGYPLGFWGGPHSEEFFMDYSLKLINTEIIIRYSNAKRGQLTEQMLDDAYESIYYERYSGVLEHKQIVKVIGIREIYPNIQIHCGIDMINWVNGGFDPYNNPDIIFDDLHDVNKLSLSMGLQYNYVMKRFKDSNI